MDGLVLLAVALAEDAWLERLVAAARRAVDVWQVATWLHGEAEDYTAAVGMGEGGGQQW
jgi:hypothetical protein